MATISFGDPYFGLNLKAVRDKAEMGEDEAQLSPELIGYGQMPSELQPYLGQEEMTGRYFRPALTSTTTPVATGGGTTGGGMGEETQGGNTMDYLSQLVGPAKGLIGKALTGTSGVPANLTDQANLIYGSMTPEQREIIIGAAPLGAGQEWGRWEGVTGGTGYPSEFTGSIYENGAGQVGATSGLGQAISGGLGALTGAISKNPAIGYIGQSVGQVAGSLLGGKALNLGKTFTGALGAGLSGQSDWTNPYSGYVESINTIIPLLGTVLGGILEGVFGKGQANPKDIPEFNQARQSGQARAQQLKAQGMTPYQIWQWAKENGYVVEGSEETGDISMVYDPREAMTIDQIMEATGNQAKRPLYGGQGWYWGSETQQNWIPGEEWKEPKYYSNVGEMAGEFTSKMSNIGDIGYLIGAPNRKQYKALEPEWIY